jgi:hypothetical protein
MPDKSISQKLSIKAGSQFLLVNPPKGYLEQLGALPDSTRLLSKASNLVEAIQVFVAHKAEMEASLPGLKEILTPKGLLRVTYYKGSSKVKTAINRATISAYAQSIGLQGVAMISIDEDWQPYGLNIS